jgi:bifunctional polynucleotide phosphatase/kinase
MSFKWVETNQYISCVLSTSKKTKIPIRIAAFDLDDTIVKLPRFKDNRLEYKLLPGAKKVIKTYIKNNYFINIFTNQSGMSQNKNFDISHWKKQIELLFKEISTGINCHFAIYCAKKHDQYRKPNLGMWFLMKHDLNDIYDKKIFISKKSFYCGDAAGRLEPSELQIQMINPATKKSPVDHSDTDRKFAMNIGIMFYTPDDLLVNNNKKIKYKLNGIQPDDILKISVADTDINYYKPEKKEVVIMIGYPGSGKSTYANKISELYNVSIINQDTCGVKAKCINLMKKLCMSNKTIIVDNTNYDTNKRFEYIRIAKENGYKKITCIWITTPIEIAKHMNNVRMLYSGETKVPNIAYAIYTKNFKEPSKKEGFTNIIQLPFMIDKKMLKDKKWLKCFKILSE